MNNLFSTPRNSKPVQRKQHGQWPMNDLDLQRERKQVIVPQPKGKVK